MEKLKCPEIRFGGFGGDWDEGTFGSSLAFLQSGKSKERSDFGKFPFYGSTGTIGYSETFDYSGASILVARVGANAGTLYAVAGNYSVSDNTLIIKLKDGNEYVFFSNLLERFNLNKLVFGSGQPLITGGHLKAINVAIPPLQEQTQIGTFLQNFDQAIALRERKYTQTQNLKKAMLEKMFPKAGSKQPEIRIKGFGGDWEESELSRIADFSKGKGISKQDIINGGANPCVRYGELYTTYGSIIDKVVSYTNTDKKDCVLSKANQVLIPASGETQLDIATASCILEDDVIIGGDLNILTTKQNGVFLAHYLSFVKRNEIAQLAQGNSVVHLYAKQLHGLSISYPCLKEQTAIGQFFKQLDDTLALQQQQLQTLKNLKQAILGKMFV
jgi:type I restriction enzyme S subunit